MRTTTNSAKLSADKVALTSFIVDTLDFILNLTIFLLTGSAVLLAETLQGASDMVASIFIIIGVKRSKVPSDDEHQFGHGRELYFWTLLAALFMLLATGVPSVSVGIERISEPHVIKNINLAFGMLIFAVVTNFYALRRSALRLLDGKGLSSLPAQFVHSMKVETKGTFLLDLIGFSSAVTGIVSLGIYEVSGDLRFDGFGAVVIGTMVLALSSLLIVSLRDLLIGKSAPKNTESKIRHIVSMHKEVKQILDFKTMYIGPESLLIDLIIFLKQALTTKEIEELIDKLQMSIKSQVPEARYIEIEVETPAIVKKERKIEKPPKDY